MLEAGLLQPGRLGRLDAPNQGVDVVRVLVQRLDQPNNMPVQRHAHALVELEQVWLVGQE